MQSLTWHAILAHWLLGLQCRACVAVPQEPTACTWRTDATSEAVDWCGWLQLLHYTAATVNASVRRPQPSKQQGLGKGQLGCAYW